jgi:hypothetical protein
MLGSPVQQVHDLTSAIHVESGLTIGHVLTALTSSTFGFQAAAGGGGGAIEATVIHDYTGDNTHNREIDLGDDYDLIFVVTRDSRAASVDHAAWGYAIQTVYGYMREDGPNARMQHWAMGAGNSYFQGKMTGADANKVKLGSNGPLAAGLNVAGNLYRIVGLKFA